MSCITRIELNPRHPQTRAFWENPYLAHRAILNAWGDNAPDRILFRLEQRGSGPRLLVQSPTPGSWDAALDPAAVRDVETRNVDPSFRAGDRFRFFLRANPTRREPARGVVDEAGRPKDGPRHPLYREEEQHVWLKRKAAAHGFAVESVDIFSRGNIVSYKRPKGQRIVHFCVDYEGVLRVVDPELFGAAWEGGIGTARGFGFGLLSLARLS